MSEKPNESIEGREPEEKQSNTASETECRPVGGNESIKSREPLKVSLFTFILTTVSLVLAAVMITFTSCSAFMKKEYITSQTEQNQQSEVQYGNKGYPFELFSRFLEVYSFADADEDAMMTAALKAYIAASGDDYAFYYTAEEYADYTSVNNGESQGIGINVIYSKATVNGESYDVIKVINVMKDSPAAEFGLRVGDLIYGVGTGENLKTVTELGYDRALTDLKGEAGTRAEFVVLRPDGDKYDVINCDIIRAKVVSESVYYRVHSTDKNVGVIKILQFDLTTPDDFKTAMDYLIAEGCTKFIFDVRFNPGGDLASIEAVLSYFLNENDVIIRTLYKDQTEEISKVSVRNYTGDYSSCNVSREDIGRYRKDDFEFAVLCNDSTASAAELFTATFRDYGLGKTVGVTTYGKGSMQSIFSLSSYGYSGALKLTVAKYFSGANGGYNEGYDGEGIEPDIYCEQSEAAESKNIYEITDDEDEQLKKALEALNN